MQKMPRVHHVLAIARIGSPRLLAPVARSLRIRPNVSSQNSLNAIAEHLAYSFLDLRVAAHPYRGRGVSGKGEMIAFREDAVLRSADVPQRGKLVIGKRKDARRIRRVLYGRRSTAVRFLQQPAHGTIVWTKKEKRGKNQRSTQEHRSRDASPASCILRRQAEQPRREGKDHDLLQSRYKRSERDDIQRMKDEGKCHRSNRQDERDCPSAADAPRRFRPSPREEHHSSASRRKPASGIVENLVNVLRHESNPQKPRDVQRGPPLGKIPAMNR